MMMLESPGISILAEGLPVLKTLEAVAAMAAHLQPGGRSAIVLPENEGFFLAAQSGLLPQDWILLEEVSLMGTLSEVRGCSGHACNVRGLWTQTSELVGIILVWGLAEYGFDSFEQVESDADDQADRNNQRLDEICGIATLGIEQKNLLEELSYRASHDALTHLWNRAWMEERIDLAVRSARNRFTGLIVIGIDAFRVFNQVLGRHAGDQLLRLIVNRLKESLDPSLELARSGGDEFTVLIADSRDEYSVERLALQIRLWFEGPFQLGEHELAVRASFGTAIARPGECGGAELQQRADQALLFAKQDARGKVIAFSEEMSKTPLERLVMERHLRSALKQQEFAVYYQPQVNLLTGKLVGVEALLRWRHSSLGLISPMTFVPLAEELGLIEEIGEWVLNQAVRQLEAWNDAGLNGIRMAVNVSPVQFGQADFVEKVAALLRQVRIEPNELELEITETAVVKDVRDCADKMGRLRELGVQIALDDFGTGHSSLAYLQHLPIDRLKIDRAFVKDITTSDERPPLLASIIQMGFGIGCEVIAEGVETVEQALAISRMGCEESQGYLFSKPLPASELWRWVNDQSGGRILEPAPGMSAQDMSASERRI